MAKIERTDTPGYEGYKTFNPPGGGSKVWVCQVYGDGTIQGSEFTVDEKGAASYRQLTLEEIQKQKLIWCEQTREGKNKMES